MSDDWFILRTSGRSTLNLAKTLAEDGFDVWTPAFTKVVRVPRMNVLREVRLPILPSYIFVRSNHLFDLLKMERMAMKVRQNPGTLQTAYHRDFSIFRYLDQIPLIADRHLEPLRDKERQAIPKKERPRFDRGANVRVNSGAFEGLKGRVERCKSGHALVIFTDYKRPVQIPTFLLAEIKAVSTDHRVAKAA